VSGYDGNINAAAQKEPKAPLNFWTTKACEVCGERVLTRSGRFRWCAKCRPAKVAEYNRKYSEKYNAKVRREKAARKQA
jgi:hypothetical protein